MQSVRVRFPFVPSLLLALVLAPPIHAAETTDAEDILDEATLSEVIVTGSLRQEPLRELAGSVTVLREDTLRDAGEQHFQDVLGLVPNINWAGGTSRPRYFQIRGIGEREQYEGSPNPSVGFLIDDIDFSGLGMPATLFDLKQVEVLRGPQGTQYGANALAGLIVVRSNDPSREAGYAAQVGGGDYGTQSLGLTATGPVEALDSAWRLSVQRYRSDGFQHNAYLDRDTNDRDELTARFKWRSWLGESTLLDFTFLHADLDNGYDGWAIDNSRTTLSDKPGEDTQLANGGALRVSTDLGASTLTAIGSYADSKSVNSYDADWGNDQSWAPYTYDYFSRFDRHRRTGSLELRLASPEAQQLAWLVGAYALRLRERGSDLQVGEYVDPDFPEYSGTSEDRLAHRYLATNLALFGQLDGSLAPRWHWSAGLRLEQRRARYHDEGVVGEEPRLSALAARDRMFGGQVSLRTDLTSSVNAYTTLSRGYKAGGFNLGNVPEDAQSFDPEYLWNIESGLKASLPEGRGYADIAVFYQRRRDQQVRTGRQLDPTNPNTYTFVTTNLPRGYTTGVEASLQYQLLRSVSVGGSLGLLRSRSGPGVDDEGNAVASRAQAHAPSYTAAVNATWRDSRGLMARIDLTAMDDFYFDVPTDHDMKSRAYSLVNLKVGYERQRWGVHAWMRNAFDKSYAVRGFFFSNEPPDWPDKLYTQKGEPRTFGLTLDVQF